ncbi:hypothetical protein K3495_g13514 [Podosphaera aphanis]|nr:hypothetical protein K3495_g13514 [Podosphaera aphanis]
MRRSLSFTSIIWTDHQPIARFLDSIHHEGIYARWCSQLRSLNIEIKYIQGVRNVVAGAISRSLFEEETYDGVPNLEELGRMDETGQPEWTWKYGKDGYQELLDKIVEPIRMSELGKLMCCSGSADYMQLGIGHTKPDQVFPDLCAVRKGDLYPAYAEGFFIEESEISHNSGYTGSEWFEYIYLFIRGNILPGNLSTL